MLLHLNPDNPDFTGIKAAADCLRNGGIIIYPTDTVYGVGCDIFNAAAVEKVARFKGLKVAKANFSFICYDLSHISDFCRPLPNPTFKLMKKALPGPFTFILPANSKIPKLFKNNKKTIGIRVPNNNIPREIVKELGNPILTTSIHDDDEIIEYATDPELIHLKYENQVDMVISGGFGNLEASTVVECLAAEPKILRQGIGELENFL